MNITMIPVAPDVLTGLVALRLSETESLNDVIRRAIPLMEKPADAVVHRAAPVTRRQKMGKVRYEIMGESHLASNATSAMISILNDLARYDDNFLPRLAVKVRGRTRNHIAQSRSEVYPDRHDLVRSTKEIGRGWFIGCNIANREKEKILRAACEVMGMIFGRDLKIQLPNG